MGSRSLARGVVPNGCLRHDLGSKGSFNTQEVVRLSPNTGDRVALYIRVSTDKQAEHGHSIEGQEAELRAYAARYGLVVVAVLLDAASGSNILDRPAFQEALELAATKGVEAILATKVDRVARDTRDLLNVEHALRVSGIGLMLSDIEVDTTTSTGRAMFQMQGVFAELERAEARKRTSAGMAAAKAKGIRLGRPPLGYVADPTRKGGILPTADAPLYDARREAIRAAIADAQAEGVTSWPKIAEHLNTRGVPTVTGKIGSWDHKRAKAAHEYVSPQHALV